MKCISIRILTIACFAFLASAICTAQAESITNYVQAKLSVEKDTVFIGEEFLVFLTIEAHTVALDQNFNLDAIASAFLRKTSDGFSHYPVERKLVNNRIHEIRRFSWRSVAISTGSVDLVSSLDLSIVTRRTDLFFSRPERQYFKIPVTGPAITILPLPTENRPDIFSGAVGQYEMQVNVSPMEAVPGDVIRVQMEIKGTGLLENVSAPAITRPENFRSYDPRLISPAPSLVYEQQIVPLSPDALTIPPLAFSFFDPDRKEYRTLTSRPITLKRRQEGASPEDRFRPDGETRPPVSADIPAGPVSMRTAILLAGIIILLLVAVIHMNWRKLTPGTIVILALLITSAAADTVYIFRLKSGYFNKNIYVVSSQIKGRVAPSLKSPQTMIISASGYVEKLHSGNGWALVKHADRQCWIPESKLQGRVAP